MIACFVLLIGTVAGVWFFIIYDIVHIARNPRLSGSGKGGAGDSVFCRATGDAWAKRAKGGGLIGIAARWLFYRFFDCAQNDNYCAQNDNDCAQDDRVAA